jgi:hypothetical protein
VPKARAKDRVLERDEQGRPTDVLFDGDPSSQCPACLSGNVRPVGAIGMLPSYADPRTPGEHFDNVRKMRCDDCGGSWMRPGL